MATMYDFKCNNCGYEVESIAGEDDFIAGRAKSFICLDCKSVVDVLIWSRTDGNINPKDYECDCGSKNLVRWDTSATPCPKCHNSMERGSYIILAD